MLQLKLQSPVRVTAFSRRIKKQVYIPFFIGDDYFEQLFLVSGQLIESLIGVDFLQQYGLVANVKTDCLKYEAEGNTKECQFANEVEAQLGGPQYSTSHGFQEQPIMTSRKH